MTGYLHIFENRDGQQYPWIEHGTPLEVALMLDAHPEAIAVMRNGHAIIASDDEGVFRMWEEGEQQS